MDNIYQPMRITGGLTHLGVFSSIRKKCFACKPNIQSTQSWDGIRYPITSDCHDCKLSKLASINPYTAKQNGTSTLDTLFDYCNDCPHSNYTFQCNNPSCVFRKEVYEQQKPSKIKTIRQRSLREGLTVNELSQVFQEQCSYCDSEGECNGETAMGPCPINTRRHSKSLRLQLDAIKKYCGSCEQDNDECSSSHCPIRGKVWQ